MKKNFNNLKNMFSSVQAIILYYIAVWTGYVPFETSNAKFNTVVGKIEDNEEIQKILTKGWTVAKRTKKRNMAKKAMEICRKIRAFASSKKDSALFGRMQITYSKIYYGTANVALAYANNILTEANAMTPAERTTYDISDGDITALTDLISEFDTAASTPRDRIVIRKAATEKLPLLFKEGSELLTDELDNLMSNYKESEPEFYEQYFNARIIVNQIRHTAIEGNVTDLEGADLKKVKVTMTGKDKVTEEVVAVFEEKTDKDGNFIKRELNPELEWDVTFELVEYEPQTFEDIDLTAGEHEMLEVKLRKVS